MASPVDVLAQQMTTSTTLVPRDGQQSLWQNKGDDENSTGHHRSNNNNTDQPQQRRHCGCRRRRSFTISPIDGMEWMQQCHPTYGVDGDVAAKRFLEEKKVWRVATGDQ